ncbi:MAG: ABC transporter permease [Dictyoglomi bacterium]|nr:ABC transporter permease [Dictyoglomota bacterium]
MGRFIVRRLALMVIALWVVVTVTFFLAHMIPGGPFDREKPVPEAIKKNLEEKYHLNEPMWKQYILYLNDIIHGDLGPSFKYPDRTVNDIIKESFPVSAQLGFWAVLIATFVGISLGSISALHQGGLIDSFSMFFAILFISLPSFVIAPIFQYIFGVKLHWLPVANWGSWEHMILPALSLALGPTAVIARLTRASMLEVLSNDYVKAAKARGLSGLRVLIVYALKNALIPVVTYLFPLIAAIFTGSFVVEKIFNIPGLGRYYVTSIYNRDYTVILGVTVFYAAFLILMNLLADITYALLDPRIRYE